MTTLLDAKPAPPDPDATRAALAKVFVNAVSAAHALGRRALAVDAATAFDQTATFEAMWRAALGLASDPARLLETQVKAWGEWSHLWAASLRRLAGEEVAAVIEPGRGDRRFSDPAWTDHPYFLHLKQSYLLGSRQMIEFVQSADGLDPAARARVLFLLRQWLDALAPTNFPATNPAALRRAVETGGVNLLSGLANLLADAASGEGLVRRRSAEDFELGVTLAATPGAVVFQTELFQLIQYDPATASAARRPLLYVPPLVNKYYLMDLQPKSSLIRWLVEQGRTVFVISWANPDESLRDKGLDAYVVDGVVAAIEAARTAAGEPDVDLAGFCMGGTLAAATAAYLAGSERDRLVGSLTLIGTLLDFSELGDWSLFADDATLKTVRRGMHPKGYVDAHDLQKLFSIMRANDLIWSSVVNHYLLDREAPPSDILYWFADGARIPAAFLGEFGDLMLRGNHLRRPGGVVIRGVPLDLAKVTAPVLMISLKDDHVSAWAATYDGARLFGGPVRFLLGGSGHNAGVINPPAANKHGFWINDALPDTAEAWMTGAARQEGSWWPAWTAWLDEGDGAKVPARTVGQNGLAAIEPAPGSYVKVRY